MKLSELRILQVLLEETCKEQKSIAEKTELSAGTVNSAIRVLRKEGYLEPDGYMPTEKALRLKEQSGTKNAVILAAGSGFRMLPVNREIPKGLFEIYGEPMIERLIKQLHEVGISEIYVVLGYMKEKFQYLEEKYGVTLLVCRDYMKYNNLYSLACAAEYIDRTYVIPCDIYCSENPFSSFELYSWYLFNDRESVQSDVFVKRSGEIVQVGEDDIGTEILGIAYLAGEQAAGLREKLVSMTAEGKNRSAFWENAVIEKKRLMLEPRFARKDTAWEINTYEDLKKLEPGNSLLKNDAIDAIEQCFHIDRDQIQEIRPLKVGMTNRSILFSVNNTKYIMRIPGEGTELIIDRYQEAKNYELLKGRGICDDNVYIDPAKGFKIAKFIENARNCNENDPEDIVKCMRILRKFHELQLQTEPRLDLFEIIDYYENMFTRESNYRDYRETKKHCMAMKRFVEKYSPAPALCHLDCNPDNFLFSYDIDGSEKIDLIDWEYSMMQAPMADLAGFITYARHDKAFADLVIDSYYPEGCSDNMRLLVYCYVALWGLYNSNWCEFREQLGVEIGEFALTSYYYAKTYYKIFEEEYRRIYGKEYEIE